MPDTPYPINSSDPALAINQMKALIDELFQERVAGTIIGDVFQAGDDDIFTLNVKSDGGIQKVEGELAVKPKSTGSVTVTEDGIDVIPVSTTKPGLAPILSDVATEYLDGDGNWSTPGAGIYQLLTEKDAVSGYAGLNASSRTTKGVVTTDDVIINLATKGLVLKDTQGTPHYWRVTVSNAGALVISDIGTALP